MSFRKKAMDLAIPEDVAHKKERKRLTFEEREAAKELERQRKTGQAPLVLDEEGKEINPHIPKFISDAPWYLSKGRASLSHQSSQKEKEKARVKSFGMKEWYARGKKQGPAATKYRKGACENCGAMTHKTKDCMDRPRKKGAKFTGKNIAADEYLEKRLDLGFEGNRDRWNGFQPEMYKGVMAKYEAAEAARQKLEAEEKQKKLAAGELEDSDSSSGEFDPDAFSKADPKTRTTTRNLRDREDRAKYLHNLKMDSAYYDPKSRSMRQNPYEDQEGAGEVTFVGDNWQKETGDTEEFNKLHRAAWDLAQKGDAPNLFASPSEAAFMAKEMETIAENRKSATKSKLLEQYGGQQYAETPSSSFLRGQSEAYVEYNPDGTPIQPKNAEPAKAPQSSYPEDVYPNNHSSVWGSWYDGGVWGFACCHQTTKSSFCIGYVPRVVDRTVPEAASSVPTKSKSKSKRRSKGKDESDSSDSSSESDSSSDSEEDRKKKRRRKSKKKSSKDRKRHRSKKRREKKRRRDSDSDSEEERRGKKGKRPKYEGSQVDHMKPPTEAEMHSYRASRSHWDDPMRKMDKM
eukprot:TRINITY_DN2354_c0_g1_i2.p1 TRINITY_DN2354_c0_g1~~TRINITY_DN2354_c0_g1_i2.p1  ORF type:complete len:587 (+),score=164.77 TRINITY_DN2354_c0_g1_i2:44-1762(+)